MSAVLTRRIEAQFRMFDDLAATLSSEALASHLGELRSNTIGQQLRCAVGVRESGAKGIPAGKWQGFHPTLEETDNPEKVVAALKESADGIRAVLVDDLSEASETQALALLEHEAGHMGQILRYLLGLRMEVPKSWERYFDL